MARIAGVDIPREKRLEISLTYIFGVGRSTSKLVCDQTGLSRDTRVRDLTEEEIAKLRSFIDANLKVEGDLRREVAAEIAFHLEILLDVLAKAVGLLVGHVLDAYVRADPGRREDLERRGSPDPEDVREADLDALRLR